jgi:hypothetical protein
MTDMPQDQKELLLALSTPGSCETVPFDIKAKVWKRGWPFIEPPIGWAVNDKPWTLTEAGRAALGEKE